MMDEILLYLKCSICKDLFNAAMSLSCSHTFCSKCIRVHLSSKTNCPTCLKDVRGINELRNVRLIDSIVDIVNKNGNVENVENVQDDVIQDDQPVQCPMCSKYVIYKDLNSHLDYGCKSGTTSSFFKRKSSKSRSFKPSVPYSCYNDKELRKILSSEGLSGSGDRQTLIKRHSEFLHIHNSNLDRLDPKPQEWVLDQVKEWEKNVAVKLVPADNHLEKYKDEYDGLIQEVISRKKRKIQTNQEEEIL